MHTLKGDSAACGLRELSELAHLFEDALTLESAAGHGALAEISFAAADVFAEMLAAYHKLRTDAHHPESAEKNQRADCNRACPSRRQASALGAKRDPAAIGLRLGIDVMAGLGELNQRSFPSKICAAALAIVTIEPEVGTENCHAQREPVPVEKTRLDLPAGLQAVQSRMMAKRTQDRFQTPAEVASALDPFVNPGDGFNSSRTELPGQTTSQSLPGAVRMPPTSSPGPCRWMRCLRKRLDARAKKKTSAFVIRLFCTWSRPMAISPDVRLAPAAAEPSNPITLPAKLAAPSTPATSSPPNPAPPNLGAKGGRPMSNLSNSNPFKLNSVALAGEPAKRAQVELVEQSAGSSLGSPANDAPSAKRSHGLAFILLFVVLACVGLGAYGYQQWLDRQKIYKAQEKEKRQQKLKELFAQGMAHSGKGEFDEAITAFTEFLELDEKSADEDSADEKNADRKNAYRERATAFNARHKFEKARNDAGEAIRLDPKDATAYRERGYALAHLDIYDKACIDFDEALRLKPDDALTIVYRGDAHFRQGELDKASADFTTALKFDSSSARIYYRRGQVKVRQGKLSEAENDYNQAIKADARFALAYCGLGDVQVIRGELAQALADFDKALKIDPLLAAAHSGKGDVFNRQGRWKEARAAFERAMELDAKLASPCAGLAQTLLEYSGREAEAVDMAEQALNLDRGLATAYAWFGAASAIVYPASAEEALAKCNKAVQMADWLADVHLCRGIAYTHMKEYARAQADFDQALERKLTLVHYARARLLLQQQQNDEALKECDKAFAAGLSFSGLFRLRAQAYTAKKLPEKAQEAYADAVKLDPDDVATYLERASVFQQLNQPDRAIADYTTVIAKDAKNFAARNSRGQIHAARRDFGRALTDFDDAIRLNARFLSPYFNRAQIYQEQKEPRKALAEFASVIGIDPKNFDAHLKRGEIHNSLGDYDSAIKDLDEAIGSRPKDVRPYRQRAIAYRHKKDYDRAIENWTKALSLVSPDDYLQLARDYTQRGSDFAQQSKFDKAIADYDSAMKSDPNNIDAYRNRADAHGNMMQPEKQKADVKIARLLELGLSKHEIEDGFESMFALSGWTAAATGFHIDVDKGVLSCPKFDPRLPKEPFEGSILTDKKFGDLVFRFDYKLEPAARIFVSVRGEKIQILDDYNLKRSHTRPAGEWNSSEIVVKGDEMKVTIERRHHKRVENGPRQQCPFGIHGGRQPGGVPPFAA